MTIEVMDLIVTKLIRNYQFVRWNLILRVKVMIDGMMHITKLIEVCLVMHHLRKYFFKRK
jgi:hypothetical protein